MLVIAVTADDGRRRSGWNVLVNMVAARVEFRRGYCVKLWWRTRGSRGDGGESEGEDVGATVDSDGKGSRRCDLSIYRTLSYTLHARNSVRNKRMAICQGKIEGVV